MIVSLNYEKQKRFIKFTIGFILSVIIAYIMWNLVVTEYITQKVTKDVTEEIAKKVVEDVTEHITKKLVEDVTKKVAEESLEELSKMVDVAVWNRVKDLPLEKSMLINLL